MDGSPTRTRVSYVVSNELVKVSSLLPSNKKRSLLVHSLIKQYGMLESGWSEEGDILVILPSPASQQDLVLFHDREYVDYILNTKNYSQDSDKQNLVEFGLEEDCPAFPELPAYVRMIAGASLAAANSLHKGEANIAICWDGGRHHAMKSQASGFCYVADCVLAIMALKRSRISVADGGTRRPRIMYLDLDLHFSDGVSQAFLHSAPGVSSPQVLTFSIHHSSPGFFPSTPLSSLTDPSDTSFDPFTLSLPLNRGASDGTFYSVWKSVEKVKDVFRPDYVILQCGADGLTGDPYAVWNWSLGTADGSMGWCVDRICHAWDCKVLLLGGGGYNSPNVARAWAYLTSIALRKPLSMEVDIPDHAAFPLYAPSFTLDVPAGNTQDCNTEEYLLGVERRFEEVADIIKQRIIA